MGRFKYINYIFKNIVIIIIGAKKNQIKNFKSISIVLLCAYYCYLSKILLFFVIIWRALLALVLEFIILFSIHFGLEEFWMLSRILEVPHRSSFFIKMTN